MTTETSADDAVLESVFSSSRDRGADSAAPVETNPAAKETPQTHDQQPKTEAADPRKETSEAQGDPSKPKGYRDPDTGRFVPLDELKSEREKRQEAQKARDEEARLRKEAEERYARLEARIGDFERRQHAAQNPPPQPPDPFTDPQGAFSYQQQLLQQTLLNERLNTSEMFARNKYGNEVVDAAVKAANDAGVVSQFVRSRDAYGDLVQWHKRQQVLARVGDDPEAYEKTIEERVRQKVLEELKTGNRAVMPGQQPQPQAFPGSLADATASGPGGAQAISDEAAMADVFGSGRKRR